MNGFEIKTSSVSDDVRNLNEEVPHCSSPANCGDKFVHQSSLLVRAKSFVPFLWSDLQKMAS